MGASGTKGKKSDFVFSGVIEGKKDENMSISITDTNKNTKYKNEYKKLDEFLNKQIIQKYFSEEKEKTDDDLIFNGLKKVEKNDLDTKFNDLKNVYEKDVLKKKDLNLSIDNNIISSIINNENTENVYKGKIIKEIESIKQDDNKYGIEHLTILLVGEERVGKTTLINYMLQLDENNQGTITKKENFVTYKSDKVPHLKLIEFKGFGFDKKIDTETIGKEALECIKGEIENNKNTNYNDFIHCIWFCITGTRLQEAEINLLEKLRNAYDEGQKIPVIMVYTQNINPQLSNDMEKFIREKKINTGFIKVMARDMVLPNNKGKIKTFGKEELIHETLNRCTKD